MFFLAIVLIFNFVVEEETRKESRLQRSTGQHDRRANIFTYASIQNDKCRFFRIKIQEITCLQHTTTDEKT
jgi:hypothetical protein